MTKTLLTGAAGFIGAAVAEALLERGERVMGLDNLNAYYINAYHDPALKQARLGACCIWTDLGEKAQLTPRQCQIRS
jgi:nucleoside-diphosphate-sugar epimerase